MQHSTSEHAHESVLLEETVGLISSQPGGVYVDATLGSGGHSEAILTSDPTISVLGIDQDPLAIELASERLQKFGTRFSAVHANFVSIKSIVEKAGVGDVHGVIADLGVSSM